MLFLFQPGHVSSELHSRVTYIHDLSTYPVPPPRNKALLGADYHWFPLIRPAMTPLFLRGVHCGGGYTGCSGWASHLCHAAALHEAATHLRGPFV